jgi:hypothetical protein
MDEIYPHVIVIYPIRTLQLGDSIPASSDTAHSEGRWKGTPKGRISDYLAVV